MVTVKLVETVTTTVIVTCSPAATDPTLPTSGLAIGTLPVLLRVAVTKLT